MLFSEVIGQHEVKQKLRNSIQSGRIPHAQLFSGPEGSGTLPLAIAYAQYLACTGEKDDDPCGECPSCRKFTKLAHPDLHFSYPVNTTSKVSKDPVSDDFIAEWREWVLDNSYFKSGSWYNYIGLENKQGLINKKEGDAIVHKLSLKSFESEYKIMIIWLPEKMHVSVSNMLLKLLEEPPEKTVFLMVSENPEQLLLTISSRMQPVRLDAINAVDLEQALQRNYDLPEEQLKRVVRIANGNYIKACEEISSSEENDLNLVRFTDIMRLCWKRDYFGINGWVEEMSGIGRERQKGFFEYASRQLRENFIANLEKPELVYQTAKEAEFSSRFHPYINGNNVVPLYDELNRASYDIERNGYARIVLFDLALHIMKVIRK